MAREVLWALYALAVRLFVPDAATLHAYMRAVEGRPTGTNLRSLRSIAEVCPRFPYALLYRGIKSREMHRGRSALKDLAGCLARDPGNPECLAEKVAAHSDLGEVKLAQRDFEVLRGNFPQYAQLFVAARKAGVIQ
mmetsp:Transcript_43294/g.110185  ORF Transcript_43294/g.110185 Transcript_43294/m.110185 type:complete len:136 (+) Transcript_43294:3-410(+)